MKKFLLSVAMFAACFATANAQKFEGIAETPQMGWNSWNTFFCDINEKILMETADIMIKSGLAKAGYKYVCVDDCWHGHRDADGFIQPNNRTFPSGIKALADYMHERGLKFGLYSDCGYYTCAGMPGSFGHEYQDAIQYARWGVDYLKYDFCHAQDVNPQGAYKLMSKALRDAGHPILFSLCEWGSNKPWLWAQPVGHSWRTTGDIRADFNGSIMPILDKNKVLRKYAKRGAWNDPDMLEVGNGMTQAEDRAHFTMWCMMAAPLMLGNDLRKMKDETLAILTNADVIAIDQDTLCVQGANFLSKDSVEYWYKPLAGGDWAFCVLNRASEDRVCELNWALLGWKDEEVSGLTVNYTETVYEIKNLWTGKKEGNTKIKKKTKSVTVPSHDVLLYRLTPKK